MRARIKMKNIIIFSGYNQRAVTAFLRTLTENRISNYYIIAASPQDEILKTCYKEKIAYVRKIRQLDIEEITSAVKMIRQLSGEEKSLIAPSTEALNRFLLDNRLYFEEMNCEIPLTDKQLYEKISDKNKFWELCRNNGICVPEMLEEKNIYTVPFAAKPKKYVSDNGRIYSPVLVTSQEEFDGFKRSYPVEEFDFQEYIDGESYYLLFYFSKSGRVFSFSQKNHLQQKGGKSILAASCSDVHNDTVAMKYKELFLKLGFNGLAMVELRKNSGRYFMIEANPRFWGPSQLFCDAGFNFFEFMLYDHGIIETLPERTPDPTVKYFWNGGIGKDNHVYLEGGEKELLQNRGLFVKNDIYNRNDTKTIFDSEMEQKNAE